MLKWKLIVIVVGVAAFIGCSQDDRDELTVRGGNALSALKGESKPGEKTPRIVKEQHDKAMSILKENLASMHALAKYLYEHETITGEEFMGILENPTI